MPQAAKYSNVVLEIFFSFHFFLYIRPTLHCYFDEPQCIWVTLRKIRRLEFLVSHGIDMN